MAVFSLLQKELREHGIALSLLVVGFLLVSLLQAIYLNAGPFSLSSLDLVRLALISLLPLSAFILGNRLIVREYLGRTRLFVEALPVPRLTPLILKYLFGLLYLAALCVGLVLLAAAASRVVDGVDGRFLLLLLAKSLSVVWLTWSIVFCFSLCGRLRLVLYTLIIILLLAIRSISGIDEAGFGPFALLDAETFAYERSDMPWSAFVATIGLAVLMSACGFLLATINEGSLTERLAKPMSRQDLVALGVLGFGGFVLIGTLMDEQSVMPFAFMSDTVVRNDEPPIAIEFLAARHEPAAQSLLEQLAKSLTDLSFEIGLTSLPVVRVELQEDRPINELDISSVGGVLIRGDYVNFDEFETDVLLAGLVHQVLVDVSDSRGQHESYHWILDGFVHWWTARQRGSDSLERQAVAVWAVDRLPPDHTLATHWQVTTNQLNYWVSESLAYSAIAYLEELTSAKIVLQLARQTLADEISGTTIESFRDVLDPPAIQFERITGVNWLDFHTGWRAWLAAQRDSVDLQVWLNATPVVSGVISTRNRDGVAELVGQYELLPDAVRAIGDDKCIFRHAYTGAFDHEIYIEHYPPDELQAPCEVGIELHVSNRFYSTGDRVLAVLEVENDTFHHPFRIVSEIVTLP